MSIYSNYTDPELTALLKTGDQAAFAEIYDRYKRILFVHAFKKLTSSEEAEDVIHDVFTSLWKRRNVIEIKTQLAGYLHAAVRNRVFKVIARKQNESGYIESFLQSISQDNCITDHLVREKALLAHIEQEIADLPPKMQEVFRMSREEYLSHKEIAQKLQLSEKTVKNQVNNALKILRVRLGSFLFLLFLLNS